MKRQLDRLKGKRLVTGDPNLMTKDEICINATPNGVEVKEIGTDGKIKDLAGGSEGSSISENKKYFKAIKNVLGIDDDRFKIVIISLGYYPIYTGSGMYISKFYTNSLDQLIDFGVPYYVIDFNSTDCIVMGMYNIITNDYPYNNLIKGINIPEDEKPSVEQMAIEIKNLFEEYFVEITKEEWLEIHNQCVAGTWVPEWEK